jgi:hypothetical protein
MFAFGVFGAATASYLVRRSIGELAMEIRYANYTRKIQEEEERQAIGYAGEGERPKLKVVGRPDKPRRTRRKQEKWD